MSEATAQYVRFSVMGTAYRAALDPGATNVPTEEGWPRPRRIPYGAGEAWEYVVTKDVAAAMASHLDDVADSFTYGDADTRHEGRACRTAAARARGAEPLPRTEGDG